MKQRILFFSFFILLKLTAFGQDAESYYNKASDLYDKGAYDSAITNLDKALQTDSVNVKYLLLKGNALEKAKQFQEAFDVLTFAIRYHPKDAYLYNQRGLLLMKVQEAEYSIRDFTTALDFEKTDSVRLTLLVNRGAAKINIRDFQGAYDDFIIALQLDTLNIGTLNNLASVCDEVGKGDLTLSYLFKIIKIDSTFIGAYGNIGFKYQEMGDYKTAIKYYNKVLELVPNEPLGYSNRAFNRYKLGDYKGALSDINLSIQYYPANSYAFRIRALIYIAIKENAKACTDIDEALRLGFTKMYGDEVEQLKKQYCK
ncbi:MAG: tetratricopeptide repeat protein [Bacteroidetes bacterium]|nr:tetratricopeptide repeat protein [Bacteroidota bacterium]